MIKNILRVGSEEEKAIFDKVVLSDITYGIFRNSRPKGHFYIWESVSSVVDPEFLGRNFDVKKREYTIDSPGYIKLRINNIQKVLLQDFPNNAYSPSQIKKILSGLRKSMMIDVRYAVPMSDFLDYVIKNEYFQNVPTGTSL